MIQAWRLVKRRHAASAFDGEGPRRYGSRWSSAGRRVTYASESQALAALEVLVHLQASAVLPSFVMCSISLPEDGVTTLREKSLPADWRAYPASPAVRAIGDAWLDQGRSLVLRVPSVLVPSEHNYLINPAHPLFASVQVAEPREFTFDPRLVRH